MKGSARASPCHARVGDRQLDLCIFELTEAVTTARALLLARQLHEENCIEFAREDVAELGGGYTWIRVTPQNDERTVITVQL